MTHTRQITITAPADKADAVRTRANSDRPNTLGAGLVTTNGTRVWDLPHAGAPDLDALRAAGATVTERDGRTLGGVLEALDLELERDGGAL